VIAATGSRLGSVLLGNGPLVWIGRISYSLYLVHWPILVFHLHWTLRPPSQVEQALMLAGSLVLATLITCG